jgi:putative polyhydroxyalkanoate system protein
MANIRIKRKHNLNRDDARAKVEELAKSLQAKLGANYQWDGDCLRFKRSGATGFIDVSREGEVEVDVKLGLVLRPMKGMIEKSINEGFDTALAGTKESRLA